MPCNFHHLSIPVLSIKSTSCLGRVFSCCTCANFSLNFISRIVGSAFMLRRDGQVLLRVKKTSPTAVPNYISSLQLAVVLLLTTFCKIGRSCQFSHSIIRFLRSSQRISGYCSTISLRHKKQMKSVREHNKRSLSVQYKVYINCQAGRYLYYGKNQNDKIVYAMDDREHLSPFFQGVHIQT